MAAIGRPKGIPCKFKGMSIAAYNASKPDAKLLTEALPYDAAPVPARLRQHLAPAKPQPVALPPPPAPKPAPLPVRTLQGANPRSGHMPKDVIRAMPYTYEERIKEKVLLPMLEEMAARCAAAGFKW